jgi:subtilisin family serine protease
LLCSSQNVAGSLGFNDNDLAYFSSRGPAYDGRIKPDLVAPGYFIKSANSAEFPSNGHCSFTDMAGTSMATPVTAGAAALVQQYFEDGFYPKGKKTASDGFKPMGALVKAVLINGAQRILPSAGPNANFQSSDWPNMDQGHGVVELDATLNFHDAFKQQGLYARGNFNDMGKTTFSTASDPPVEVKFKSTGVECHGGEDKQFRATLSWFDRPASGGSARR